jgi:DNA-binding CsgD family transcriptional regulator
MPERANKPDPISDSAGPAFLTAAEWQSLVARIGLSQREAQIASRLLNGGRERVIARDLGMSPHTVHTHIRRLYGKLRVADRTGFVSHIFARYAELTKTPSPNTGE